ncbi:MAG TPA: anti-sigma factor [Blastocatellia bacterium]|nr:anti-sigma factor [Blastocatellia bacterium]
MRHEGITDEGQQTAALYALGALSQNEASAFEAHLREGCPACQEEFEGFSLVVGTLGSSAEAVAPPTYLRDLLKARLKKETQAAVRTGAPSASIIPFPRQSKAVESQGEKVRTSPSRTRLPWAIAAALLIALLSSLLLWRSDRRTLQASINDSKAEAVAALREGEELRSSANKERTRAQELAQINSALAASNQYEVLSLKATENAPATMAASSGAVYWDKQDKRWIVTTDLPRPPEGKAYQLWFVTSGAPVSAGILEADESGHGFKVVNVPPNVEAIVAAAITLEPQSGSPQPTTPILAIARAA